ncbi:MAG: hypothetical protein AAGA29_07665 [Planctomycetota bacterium]
MATPPTHQLHHLPYRLLAALVVALLILCLAGCNNTPNSDAPDVGFSDLQSDIPLPDLGPSPDEAVRPNRIHAIVQRIDVPLDQSTDNAWAVTDEDAFPAITRSIWHANGLRLGLLGEDDVEAFAEHMPEVLELFETQVYTSSHPVAVMRTPRLRDSMRIPVDLTLPPAPPHNETILGGEDGKLQLLARLEIEDGKTYVVLTPHHAQPDGNRLQPRDLLERELEGRMYDELAIRVELTDDRLLIVGLYWPWPIGEAFDDDEHTDTPQPDLDITWQTHAPSPALADDPAAPPPHLWLGVPDRPETPQDENTNNRSETDTRDPETANDPGDTNPSADPQGRNEPASIRRTRIAPPLPLHFGRVLLTGTRARKPVQTFLLISIPPQDDTPAAPSIDDLDASPPTDLASSPTNSD